jgi:hypothetical protein
MPEELIAIYLPRLTKELQTPAKVNYFGLWGLFPPEHAHLAVITHFLDTTQYHYIFKIVKLAEVASLPNEVYLLDLPPGFTYRS